MATFNKSFVQAALATAALGVFASASQAGLMMVYDLRMADGTKTATLSAAGTPVVKLYATLWGTDADLTNDNWTSGYFGISSSQGSTALITAGNVTLSTTSFNGPFNDVGASAGKAYSYNGSRYVAGSAQTSYQPAADGITDWGGSVSTTITNWALWSAASQTHSSQLSGGTSVNDGLGHSGYEYLLATFTINATAVSGTAGAKTFFNVDTPVTIDTAKQYVKNGGSSSFLTIAGEGTNNVSGLQVSIGTPIEFDASGPGVSAASYSLGITAGASRIMKNQATVLTASLSRTGAGTDTLDVTGLTATGGTVTAATGSNLTSLSTTGGTFSAATAGAYTVKPTVTSVINHQLLSGATFVDTSAAVTINVIDDRQVTASTVHFGRAVAGAVSGSTTLTTDTTSDFLTNIGVSLSSTTDGSHGSIATTGSGTQSFSKTQGNNTALGLGGTIAGSGFVSGSVTLTNNGEAGLAGQTLTPVSVGYDATVLINRVVTGPDIVMGRFVGTSPGGSSLLTTASGDSSHATSITVNGVKFDGNGVTSTYNLAPASYLNGPVSFNASVSAQAEGGVANESLVPVNVHVTGTELVNRVVTGPDIVMGRFVGTSPGGSSLLTTTSGDSNHATSITVNGKLFDGNGVTSTFNLAPAVYANGPVSTDVSVAASAEGVYGEALQAVSVHVTGTSLVNRVVTGTAIDLGRFLATSAVGGTSTLSTASGDNNHATAIVVAGTLFNGNGVTGSYTLPTATYAAGPVSFVQPVSASAEGGVVGESLVPVNVNVSGNSLNKRSVGATASATVGRVLANSAINGVTVTVHAPGADASTTRMVIGGIAFDNLDTSDRTLSQNFTTNGSGVNPVTLPASEELVAATTGVAVNVTGAIVGTTPRGAGTTYGAVISGKPIGGNLANMSATDDGNITVKFLAGNTDSANLVSMQFAAQDAGNEPHLTHGYLQSDKVSLTFSGTTPAYVLSMTYRDPASPYTPYATESDLIAAGQIFLIAKTGVDAGGAYWENAIAANTGNALGSGFHNESYAAFMGEHPGATLADVMGNYGIDTVDHSVWAVLDHATEFSVVPEPATLGLLTLGALGLLSRRRKA